jgi:putative spermidine/putrescine transport system substrate-binding protein
MGDFQEQPMKRCPWSKSLRALLGATFAIGALALAVPTANAQPAGVESEVVMATFGGTIEQFVRADLVPAFEKATGIKVKLVVGTALTNYAKVVAGRSNPDIDVYWANELTHEAGKQQGLYEKLDPKVVTNLVDVYDFAKNPEGIGVGVYVLATGIQYNSKALKDAGIPPPTSWNDLWDPRLKGKVALYSFDVAYSQDLLVLLTRLAGGTEKDVRPGIERLKSLKASGNLTAFASSPAELDNMLVQGQAWMTVNGSPRAFILKDRGAPIDFAFPKEGAGYFTNYFEVLKNAPHPKAAQILVNFLVSPEGQLAIAKGVVAAPINRKVVIPDSLRGKVPLPDEMGKLVRIDRGEMNRQLDNWAELWRREVEGKR